MARKVGSRMPRMSSRRSRRGGVCTQCGRLHREETLICAKCQKARGLK